MKKMTIKRILSLILCIALCLCFVGCKETETSNKQNNTNYVSSAPIDDYSNKTAIITVKNYGEIHLELYTSKAPVTVYNFVKLVNEGFYDGLTFHRIDEGFMIQGGDPEGTGMGGSDETIFGEFSANGFKNDISHVRGVISMARLDADKNSATSQFFIVHQDSTFLDGQYAAFGMVTKGMEIVDKIAEEAIVADEYSCYVEKENQPIIESIKIVE